MSTRPDEPAAERKRARIAVIGAGSWASEAHMPAIAINPNADLVAVADPAREAREHVAARYPDSRVYASYEELLVETEPDGVIISTTHAHHYRPARAALEAGAHVLVEKPMVLCATEARDLQRLARERERELIVGYTWHYNRQAIELRELITAGRLGQIEATSCLFASMVREYYRGDTEAYQPELKLKRAPRSNTYSDPLLSGGGQGQTQVTHSAALLFWLTGLRPRRVSAFCANFGLPVDLVDGAVIAFHDGAIGTVTSTGDRPSGHEDILRYQICGTEGIADYDVMEGVVSLYLANGRREALASLAPSDRYPHWAPANNLVDVILGRGENQSSSEIGCLVVEFLDAMYRSAAAEGAAVELASITRA